MIFLILSIIAAVVICAVVLRRLPYLRTHRPGLEIVNPRPYIGAPAWWQAVWFRVLDVWFLLRQRTIKIDKPRLPRFSAPWTAENAPPVQMTAYPDPVTTMATETAGASRGFWSEAKPDSLDLPSKGLITRRGEAQKIAHELTVQADAAFRKKEYKTAEKFYLQAATKDPDNARIYNRLGVIYLRTKNYRDAVEAFRGSIKFDDRVASRHYNLALAYLGKKDYRSAERAITEAIRLEPTNDKYRQTLDALK